MRFYFLVVLLVASKAMLSQQIYTDAGAHLNTYSQTGPLQPELGVVMPSLRVGLDWKEFFNARSYLKFEMGYQRRAFNLSYPERSFSMRSDIIFIGLIGEYEIKEYFIVETGLFPMLTVTRMNPIPFFMGAFDQKKDEGYRYFDLELSVGGVVFPHERIGIGVRGRLGLIPMLKYSEISDYGRIEEPQNYMRCWTLDIFVRVLWQTRD